MTARPMKGQLALPVGFLAEPRTGLEPLPFLRAPADWMSQAACADPSASYLPWTADGEDVPVDSVSAMAEVCDSCPVRKACAEFTRPAELTAGFWAGRYRTHVGARSIRKRRIAMLTVTNASSDGPDGLDLSGLSERALGQIGTRLLSRDFDQWADQVTRVGNCAHPIKLIGSSQTVNAATG
jgi:hypothetical protein